MSALETPETNVPIYTVQEKDGLKETDILRVLQIAGGDKRRHVQGLIGQVAYQLRSKPGIKRPDNYN